MSAARCCAHGRTVASRSDNPCPIGLPGCEASKPEGLVERIERVRTLYLAVMVELNEALVAACAGFHIPRQHRDGKPPWCDDCGRGRDGVQWRDLEPES